MLLWSESEKPGKSLKLNVKDNLKIDVPIIISFGSSLGL